ncbi:MAG: bifunctional tRNA (5-methylaminomethyl-2-thiouridine)(34)-methyltransferase MnmD/FAD-dependent 5-carboxymethylaminomethyl-2-thiouridine(34) oxidoreductase MnmC, partial [Bdellovibrionales bacterium]|nr:bifunctional tRNA (5-methylaminomethyl-2-thiouridine)(34)-methyltransferase MnmD/FAD-dependent 5-carboxymethylaminomethyl-2-thiouridine(34) oxidoreductase MnmC [Bdellovibrionales bacterium]
MTSKLEEAKVFWSDDGTPRSALFDDVYFSPEDGVAETLHVFLAGNGLPDRFRERERFVIGELGFGTGLNFLVAWHEWLKVRSAGAQLHFVSFERFPLRRDAIETALARWPELGSLVRELLAHYPPAVPGFHRLLFDGGRVALTLVFGDAREELPELEAQVDAWFFDGFAPSKNPELWTAELCHAVARSSAPDATVATFSSARVVKDGLSGAGFSIERCPGYGRKREMLRGVKGGEGRKRTVPKSRPKVAVIGGGIAGTQVAYAFARRGCNVVLVEQHAEPAQEASGNLGGIIMGYAARRASSLSRLQSAGFLFSLRQLQELRSTGFDVPGARCGVLHLACNERVSRLVAALEEMEYPPEFLARKSAEEAGALAGVSLPCEALWYPEAGWVSPVEYCKALLAAAGCAVQYNQRVDALQHNGEKWSLSDEQGRGIDDAELVIVACAYHAKQFPMCKELPLRRLRGQVAHVRATEVTAQLRTVLCHDGYMLPAESGVHLVGATFDRAGTSTELISDQEQELLRKLKQGLPVFSGEPLEAVGGRAAFRTTTPDHLPLVGLLSGSVGLGVSLGHGSRGLVTAGLASEILAAEALGEPQPVSAGLRRALSPQRFAETSPRRDA